MQKALFAKLAILASGLWLAACAPQPQIINLSSTFDPAEVKFILTDGDATITGQAFLRQSGGGVVTCAGSTVYLTPRTKYAEERSQHIYGSTLGGLFRGVLPKFVPDSSEYHELIRTTQCDAQGDFEFSNVPAGKYYVGTWVQWVIANVQQGGAISKPVDVAPGQKVSVLLTQ